MTAAPERSPRSRLPQLAGRRGGERLEQVPFQQRENRLRLGVAEAAVELEDPWPVLGEHEPGEEQPDEGRPARWSSASTGR